jgi:hypothetical protein
MTKKQFEDVMIHLCMEETKYNDLVWYVRSKSEHNKIPGVKENKERIESEYAEEIEKLKSEFGDWEHGFNSGVLAGVRYALALLEYGVEDAIGTFPDLDT